MDRANDAGRTAGVDRRTVVAIGVRDDCWSMAAADGSFDFVRHCFFSDDRRKVIDSSTDEMDRSVVSCKDRDTSVRDCNLEDRAEAVVHADSDPRRAVE